MVFSPGKRTDVNNNITRPALALVDAFWFSRPGLDTGCGGLKPKFLPKMMKVLLRLFRNANHQVEKRQRFHITLSSSSAVMMNGGQPQVSRIVKNCYRSR